MTPWILWAIPIVATGIAAVAGWKDRRWNRYSWKGKYVAVFATAVSIAAIYLITVVVVFTESRSCESQANHAGYDGKWTAYTDCLVNKGDGWFPLDQVIDLRGDNQP